jgi:glycosyltransferase involved in cell wall biosynthesis
MNIVLHIPSLMTGGAERQLVYLAKGLADRNHQVHVITFFGGGAFWDELAQDPRIRLYSLERKGKWDFFIVFKLYRYFRKNGIQLIHAFLPPSSTVAALATIFSSVSLVIGIRASDMRFRFGARLYKSAERILGNWLAERYICNSYAGRNYNISLGYDERIMSVIPNGLYMPTREYAEPFSTDRPIRLAMASRLVPMKDIPTMLRAFVPLFQKLDDIELWIYGDGDESYRQELIELSVKLGIDNNVRWKGWVSPVWEIFDNTDILVSSSCSGEGMSNILMEAMLAGRVVVSTDVGDARRLLDSGHGQMGYLVPKSDPQALSDALWYAINNPDESIGYARMGQDFIERDYSVAAMVDAYDKLYTEILD